MADIFVGTASVHAEGLTGIPMIRAGNPLGPILAAAIRRSDIKLTAQDAVVVTQKIVSKSENRAVHLAGVSPSPRAEEIAGRLGKDPRKIEVILRETRRIVREGPEVLICENLRGQICANAGVDESNLDDPDTVLLQPGDPDASADRIRREIAAELGVAPGVIISDSYGRPWRLGLVNIALGISGFPALMDLRGRPDHIGKTLTSTELAVADELASLAGLVMGKLERIPAAVIQGYRIDAPPGRGTDMLRPETQDLFR